jgi:restriction endonuclease S subunit
MEKINTKKEKLINVCEYIIGGTPSRKNPDYWGGMNKWLSIKEMNNNIIYDTKEHITDLGVSKSNVKLCTVGTILMSFKLSIGKIAIAGVELYTNEAICGINSKDSNYISNKYIYYLLTTINHISSNSLIGSAMNKQSIGEIKLIIPGIEKQNEIIKYCDHLMNAIDNNKIIIQKNIELIDSILNL